MKIQKNRELNRMLSEIQNEATLNRKDVKRYMERNRIEVAKLLDKTLMRKLRRRH